MSESPNGSSNLVLYDRMRVAVQQCARIDEAKELRDKAAALAQYAKQRDDTELDCWMSEIKLRAAQRIGQLSRELEKAEAHGGKICLPTPGKSKSKQLSEAGISTSSANRYEELAAPIAEAIPVFSAATENYFAQQANKREPPTRRGILGAVRGALKEAGIDLPKRQKQEPHKLRPESEEYVSFHGPVEDLAEHDWNFSLIFKREEGHTVKDNIANAFKAASVIKAFLKHAQAYYPKEYQEAKENLAKVDY